MKVVVLGVENVSSHFINLCEEEKFQLALIDSSETLLEPFKNKNFIKTFQEDFHHSNLFNANFFKNTELFFSVTNSDETNLIACKAVSEFGVPQIVCCNRYLELNQAQEILETELGNYRIVNPSKLLAREITRNIETPNSIEQFWFFDNKLCMTGFRLLELCSLNKHTINHIFKDLRKLDIIPVGLQRNSIFYNFTSKFILQEGDYIYFLCSPQKLKQLRKILGYYKNTSNNIIILGGGLDGYNLALALKQSIFNFNLKIIEPDLERCRYLTEKLNDVIVLNLDLLDIQGLLDEGIENTDIFVAASDDNPSNLLSCFLVAKQNIPNLICSVEHTDYISLLNKFSKINIRVVCSNLLTSRLLGYLLYSKQILRYYTIQNTPIEVLELVIDLPALQGYYFKELALPSSVKLQSIYRNKKVIIPDTNYKLHLGDNILITLNKADKKKTLQKLKPKL